MSETAISPATPASDLIEVLPAPELRAPQANENARNLFRVLVAVSFCHLLNDLVQSLLPSIYPILKSSFHLDFSHLGYLTLTYQIVASLLQPIIGRFTDGRPVPYALSIGMTFTLVGLILLAFAPTFLWLMIASSL